eukprot:TRINITY_DN11199_c0_g1_i3.p1 TRINITY_DN11199_c0_g1~~TRINITY_DN11199_c0_g1_i3.p1  ORF type:complete len:439 (+),score=84.95 TRINITY_DN11199_c0_g1_i3:123-1439(+)
MTEEVEAPLRFRFFNGGQEYYLGQQIARKMGRPLWQILQLYPSMYRRQATRAERSTLAAIRHVPPEMTIVTLLLAEEIDAIEKNDHGVTLLQAPPAQDATPMALGRQSILLTRSSRVPVLPQQPATTSRVAGPKNPLAQYYRSPHGLASTADDKPERLVPIRINLDHDGHKFRDQFMWNANDKTVTPLMFATILAQDAELPIACRQLIAKAIQEQLDASKQSAVLDLSSRHAHIKVEVQYGASLLRDNLEWSHGSANVEQFAQVACNELGLPQEYVPVLAHGIHEQLLNDRRGVLLDEASKGIEHPGGLDTTNVFRPAELDVWSPGIYALGYDQLDRNNTSEDRETRRRRRYARGKDDDRSSKKAHLSQITALEPPDNLGPRPLIPELRVRVHLERQGAQVNADGSVGAELLNTTRHEVLDESLMQALPSTSLGARSR